MLVMLDLDNTLCDRERAVRAWIAELAADRGLDLQAEGWMLDQDRDGYSPRREVMASIIEHFNFPDTVDALLAAYQARVIKLSEATPGALDCLASLRSTGHAIAIVSNGSTKQQHGKIDALGLRELVDTVVVSEDLGIKKPDPRIFRAAADAVDLPLADSWMVGDSPLHDIVGGSAVGAGTVWLDRGRTWNDPTTAPTVTITSLTELPSAIEGSES